MSDQNKFKQTMLLLATTYDKALTTEQAQAYWSSLGKYNSDYLHTAALQHIDDPRKGEWFPRPAHLIAIVNQLEEKARQHQEIIKAQNRIERKPPTDEQKKRVSDLIKGLKNEL